MECEVIKTLNAGDRIKCDVTIIHQLFVGIIVIMCFILFAISLQIATNMVAFRWSLRAQDRRARPSLLEMVDQ